MPYDLKNLDLDEVSLVGKAANSKKFLIFKSMQKSKGSVNVMKTKPAGARAGAGEAQVTKADIEDIVNNAVLEAVSGVKQENVNLKKALQTEKSIRIQAELKTIAKSDYPELGDTSHTAEVLKSIKDSNLPEAAQKSITDIMRQANEVKKEAMKVLGAQIGTSKAAPGTPAAAFNAAVEERLGEIRKSAGAPKDAKVAHAQATTWVTQNKPELFEALTGGE